MLKDTSKNIGKVCPFLRWAGGKRWLVRNHPEVWPAHYNNYIEPFLGSGAVYFHLRPRKAVLNDSNGGLMETYQAIKDNYLLVLRYLKEHNRKHNTEYYYRIRGFRPQSPYTRAARFIYLNRTCWNGLYRVNSNGDFNVPIGTKERVLIDGEDFSSVSDVLKNASLHSVDFEKIIDMSKGGDLLFVDPPYTVKHNNNSFVQYNERLFSWSDQLRLAQSLRKAKRRGVRVICTNANHESIKDLYSSEFETKELSRNSLISGNPQKRGKYKELLIMAR